MRLSGLIIRDLQVSVDDKFGESRARFINSNQETYGVSLPVIRRITSKQTKSSSLGKNALISEARYLIKQKTFDCKIAGIEILAYIQNSGAQIDIEIVENLIQDLPGWALIDTLSTDVVSNILKGNPTKVSIMLTWAKSDNNWLRRCAVVSTIKAKSQLENWNKHKEQLLGLLVNEKDRNVRKAIKWLEST